MKDGLIVLAGINSSEKDQQAGKNEHFRAFDVQYPPRKKQKTDAAEDTSEKDQRRSSLLGKRSLFKPDTKDKKESYQRLLRLSPPRLSADENKSKRIGAVATGLAKNSQIIVFNATNPTPSDADILTRIDLDEKQEANDFDLSIADSDDFSLAFCTDDGIHEQTYKYDFAKRKTEKTPKGPRRVYQIPFPDVLEKPSSRAKFRCLRFLGSQNVVALVNKPEKSGAELRIFHLYPTGPAIQILEKKLPGHIKSGVSMDVCALDADKDGNQQFVLAVAGADVSIEVYTTNFNARTSTFSPLRSYLAIRDVHQHQMTKLCFSPFHPPTQHPEMRKDRGPVYIAGPQFLRLASVSYGNTVVVDTFPLQPLLPNKVRESRYVLSHPSDETWAKYTYLFVGSLIVIVIAFMIQSFRTGFADEVGMFSWLPAEVRELLDMPAGAAYGTRYAKVKIETGVSSAVQAGATATGKLQSLMDRHDIPIPTASILAADEPVPDTPSSSERSEPESEQGGGEEKVLLIRPGPAGAEGVTVDVHPDKSALLEKSSEAGDEEGKAKHWHELHEHEQSWWKERLQKAGQWAEAEGEGVLQGILFSGKFDSS